jgi:hypothetical protein
MTISERRAERSPGPVPNARALQVTVTEDALIVRLEDGRDISVPLAWFPRLLDASADQRTAWNIIGNGIGIHWEELDEDISVEGLLATREDDLLIYKSDGQEPLATNA